MKHILFLVVGILYIGLSANTLIAVELESDGKITGIIYDKQINQPVEYATITMYNNNDSSLVTGTISNEKGGFDIDNLKKGDYYAVVRFIGYSSQTIGNIHINNNSTKIDLGIISLATDEKVLDAVEVVAQEHNIEYQIDKKIISVGQELTTASMSAVEVLENVPSIRVDIDGNILLRGSAGFTVLIDGKPTVLDPSDVLRQTPASTIQNIEIITNPSAKYEPDGTGGIINIITKKNRSQGIQGLVNLNVGRFNQYGGDFLLNYRKKSINFFIGGEYGKNLYPGQSSSERHTVKNDTITIIRADGLSERLREQNSFRTGFNWDINENNKVTIEANAGKSRMNNSSELNYLTTIEQTNYSLQELSFNEYERSSKYFSASGNYLHKFQQEKHELMLQVNYGYAEGDEFSTNFLEDENHDVTQGTHRIENGPSGEWNIRMDYSEPFGEKNMLEVGWQIRLDKNTDKTGFNVYEINTGEFTNLPEYTNEIQYISNIYSLYSLFRGYIKSFGYQLGLRGEYMFRDVNSIQNQENFILKQFDYFPTLHLSYQLPGNNQVMTSYSRRIDRPGNWYLEPFLSWTDMFNVSSGNPDLKNEYIDAYEIGYVKEWKKSQFSIESYYRVKHNKIEQVQSVFDDGVLLSTFENIGTDYSLGVEVMYSTPLTSWWDISFTGDLFDYRIKGIRNGEPLQMTSINWSNRASNIFRFSKIIQFQLDGQYISPTISSQGKMMEYWMVNCALRADFLDKKLSVTLQARDLFATANRISTNEDTGLYNYQQWQSDAPFISLSIRYRINNFKAKVEQRNENNITNEF